MTKRNDTEVVSKRTPPVLTMVRNEKSTLAAFWYSCKAMKPNSTRTLKTKKGANRRRRYEFILKFLLFCLKLARSLENGNRKS